MGIKIFRPGLPKIVLSQVILLRCNDDILNSDYIVHIVRVNGKGRYLGIRGNLETAIKQIGYYMRYFEYDKYLICCNPYKEDYNI